MSKILFNKDIIIVGQQPWDTEIGSNCKNIALEMSKHNRVLYVNSPLDRISKLRNRKDPKVQKRLRVIDGNENGLVEIKSNQKSLLILFPHQGHILGCCFTWSYMYLCPHLEQEYSFFGL